MPDKQMVNMLYDADLLKRIDDFRFQHRFESRTEAIRWLIQAALDKKLAPKEQPKEKRGGKPKAE
jgi:metal-responsive CopG/Arc/MetJ family transcriptional regulator